MNWACDNTISHCTKIAMPGNHFVVYVDDKTSRTELISGM